jgi:hypothetical protein
MPRTRQATSRVAPAGETRSDGAANVAKRSDRETVVTLRLPRDLHERLKKAGGERGLSEQIRRRLEASLVTEASADDPKTRDLVAGVAQIANEASRYYRRWHEDPHTFAIVQVGIDLLLASYRPKGDPVPTPNPDNLADLLWAPEHAPEDVARALVASVIHNLREGR